MRILLVESGNNATGYLRKGLRESGFTVDVARRRHDAGELAARTNYDLLVCDDTPPPGYPVFRESGKQIPVLFLMPPGGSPDASAANCLRTPFAFSDLLASVHSILRWGPGSMQEILEIADLQVNLVRHRASRGGIRLDLTPKEYLLLSLLMRRSGAVLPRALIADQVWDINFESNTNFVDVHIRRLRSKVDDPFSKKLIHTVRGAGYVLEDRG